MKVCCWFLLSVLWDSIIEKLSSRNSLRVKINSFFVFLKWTWFVLIVLKYGSPGTLGIEVKRTIIYGRSLASTMRPSVLEQNPLSQIGSDGSSTWRVIVVWIAEQWNISGTWERSCCVCLKQVHWSFITMMIKCVLITTPSPLRMRCRSHLPYSRASTGIRSHNARHAWTCRPSWPYCGAACPTPSSTWRLPASAKDTAG